MNRCTFRCCISDCAVHLSFPTIPYYEFEDVSPQSMATAADGSTIVSVQGRLKEHSTFWLTNLEASEFVKEIVQFGYRIPFLALPAPIFRFNHQSALQSEEFVSAAIVELEKGGCVVPCSECPLVCNPLSVVQKDSGKRRLVVDLRYVNQYLPVQKFKYEGLNLVPQMCGKGDWFITFDLKSGYHHVDINVDCWKYLGFSWSQHGVRKFYMFRVLPFGLSSACYVFTKLLRPLVCRWRSKGIQAVMYIDDGIVVSKSESQCCVHRDMAVSDLERAGFVLNLKKCCLEPCQTGKWLGFTVNLSEGKFLVPVCKLDKLKASVGSILQFSRVPVRSLASAVGQIISMSLAMGPITRLRMRALYAVLNSRSSWADKCYLPAEAREELEFWQTNVQFLNGRSIWFNSGTTRVVYSDASSTGYGGYVVELGNEVVHGHWSVTEVKHSSTWRELKAVYLVLQSFASRLAGHSVKWFTDNQGVVHIVSCGSKKPHLQDGAMAIFELCFQHSIKLEMDWIPRSLNTQADFLSRIVDYDDWGWIHAFFVH